MRHVTGWCITPLKCSNQNTKMHKIMAFILLCKSVSQKLLFAWKTSEWVQEKSWCWDKLKRTWVWIIKCRLVWWCREGTGLLWNGIRKLYCLKHYSLFKVYDCLVGMTLCTWEKISAATCSMAPSELFLGLDKPTHRANVQFLQVDPYTMSCEQSNVCVLNWWSLSHKLQIHAYGFLILFLWIMCTCQSQFHVEDHVNYDKYRYLTKMLKPNLDITSLITRL